MSERQPSLPSAPGTYALLIQLESPATLEVGRLGEVRFESGWFAYIGSALGGLAARIGRHIRQDKRLHWHVDYLLTAGQISEVLWENSGNRLECCIATALERRGFESLPRLGSSDCLCSSHLFFSPTLAAIREGVSRAFSSFGVTPKTYHPIAQSEELSTS